MPWIGVRDGDTVIPEGIENGNAVTCPGCEGQMYPRGPSSDGRARHFFHTSSGNGGGSCVAGEGESETHRKWKSFAVSRLKELYTESERDYCGPEIVLDVDEIETDADYRQADALVRFKEPHDRLGNGLIVEVQYKNKEKDIEATTNDYLQPGYSVVWAKEDDFSSDRCLLDRDELESRAVSVFPNAVPEPEDWEEVKFDLRGLNHSRSEQLPNVWSTMDTYADRRQYRNRQLTSYAYGVDFSPMSERQVKLPVEWYEDRARQYYRETEWNDLFEDYVWDPRNINDEWADLAGPDLDVNIHLSKWLADDGKMMVEGDFRSSILKDRGSLTTFVAETVDVISSNGENKTVAFVESVKRPEDSLEGVEWREGIGHNCIMWATFYVPSKTIWEDSDWGSRFPGSLKWPVKAFENQDGSVPQGEIPIRHWFSKEGFPDQVRKRLYDAYKYGRENMPKSKKAKSQAMVRVPRIVKHNTGSPQPDSIKKRTVLTIASHANIPSSAVLWAIEQLVEQGKLQRLENNRYQL